MELFILFFAVFVILKVVVGIAIKGNESCAPEEDLDEDEFFEEMMLMDMLDDDDEL